MFDVLRDPADLRALYPLIEEGVEAIRAKAQMDEIAADVYAAAQTGAVSIALLADGDKPWGWTAFYPSNEVAGRDLVSWMTYIRPGAPTQLLEELLGEMDRIAAETGSRKITFVTSRRAWARRLAPYGYRIGGLILEKEVEHG